MIEFWKEHKVKCLKIRSINIVYDEFLEYYKNKNNVMYPPLNKYVFRAFIRKNGYCNN